MAKESIILYPVTIQIGNDSSSYKSSLQNIVTQHSNQDWVELVKEFKNTTKDFEDSYGLKITNVKRYKDNFIKSTVEVIDEDNIKQNFGEDYCLSNIYVNIIQHNLQAGGYPSFYKDNKENGKMISSYVVVETKFVRN